MTHSSISARRDRVRRTAGLLLAVALVACAGLARAQTPGKPGDQALVTGYLSLKAGTAALQNPLTRLKRLVIEKQEAGGQSWDAWRGARYGMDRTRAEFAGALKFLEQVRDKSDSPEIQALSEHLARVYRSFDQALKMQQQAVETEDAALLRLAVGQMRLELTNVITVFATEVPLLKARVTAAVERRGLKQTEQIGCPYPYGTPRYFMNCIGANELSTTGN